jgi:hypothetical protein
VFLINENFENGLNGFSNSIINNNTAVNSKTAWQSRTSTFVPAEQVWFPPCHQVLVQINLSWQLLMLAPTLKDQMFII